MRSLIVQGVVLAGLAWSLQAAADPLLQAFSMPLGTEYDSNPTLSANDAQGVTRYRLAPQYQLSYKGIRSELGLSLGARIERSSDTRLSSNRQDPNVGVAWQYFSPTSALGLNFKYDQASARTTELEETGIVTVDRTRTTKALGASWSNTLSERNSLTLNGDYKVVTHDGGTLTDYDTKGVSATFGHQLGERSEVFVTGSSSRFEPKSAGQRSSSHVAMLGYKARTTETLDWMVQGGAMRITGDNSDTNWQGNWRLNYAGERVNTSFDVGRSAAASGVLGGFATNDFVRFQIGYALSELSNLSFDASHTKTKSALDNSAETYGATFGREMSPFWRLAVRLQHKEATRPTDTASGHLVGVTLIYSHPDF